MNTSTRTSGFAIAALSVGCISICLAFLAPVAIIFGIIALVKIGDSKGELGGKGLAIGGLVTGGLGLFMIPVLAAIAIPNFIKYQLRSKQSEAKVMISSIHTGAGAYFAEHDTYPQADTGWVPATPCGPAKCTADPSLWTQPPWSELGFSPAGDHYYQYRYSSDGRTYSIEAQADLDGDGKPGHFQLTSETRNVVDLDPNTF